MSSRAKPPPVYDADETVVGDHPSDYSSDQPSTDASERRRHARTEGRLRVVVVSGNVVFRTFSFDISDGGIRLEQAPPPQMLQGPVDIYISSPEKKSSLRFKAKLIGHQRESLRFAFLTEEGDTQLLHGWVESVTRTNRVRVA